MAQIIHAVKRGGRPDLLQSLAIPLAFHLRPLVQSSPVITWVPASPKGRRHRGFDQGRLLAKYVARELDLRSAPSLARSGRAQFGSNRTTRLEGPRLRIRPDWAQQSSPEEIVLIDDVITTGASMAAAASCLELHHRDTSIIGAALAMKP
ncbi:MAG: ComF family protein [Acidimicrobiales bacterium]|nr:ComF family protein [Acidimicrobiales bacterium]